MSNVFLRLLNISITAGWIVLVVVLLRFVLKKAPKWIRVALWGLVALRLLLPVSIESVLSLVPSAETVQVETVSIEPAPVPQPAESTSLPSVPRTGERIVLHSGFEPLNSAVNLPVEEAAEHVDTVAVVKTVAGWVWLLGASLMLLYAAISYLRLRHKVRASVKIEKGVYVCDDISDPFILGLIRPRICLPSGMDETTKGYVLAHERAHLKRFDHIWKPLGFLLLSVYWFNPLLWLAYILLCRDIELACDEKVVKEYDVENKAAYSEALLKSSVSRRSIAACPLAFGEVGVKSRIKSILNYKKPAFWIILVALLAGIVTAVCFLTVPKKSKGTYVGTWELYKLVSDGQEYDSGFLAAMGIASETIILSEDGTGSRITEINAESQEILLTYTADHNDLKLTLSYDGILAQEVTYAAVYDPKEDTLSIIFGYESAVYTRKGSMAQSSESTLTLDRLVGVWETDSDDEMSAFLSGTFVVRENGVGSLTLANSYQDSSSFTEDYPLLLDGNLVRFTPDGDVGSFMNYDPKNDTLSYPIMNVGILVFRRTDKPLPPSAEIETLSPVPFTEVTEWFDARSESRESLAKKAVYSVDAFPDVVFLWKDGSWGDPIQAVENGKTRTLFSGMPVLSVYFADLTGDGKPELCATVSFGSGIVDDHIIVYDYANKQSYVLWDRMQFDFHLYTADGALYVGKTPYMGDKQIDSGTLMMHDGVLSCRWQSDGSYTPLLPELHESELYGEWLVEEETDNDGNVLYTFPQNDLWKEYSFREDGTVVYNETVPISSDSEKAFGHPVEYPYEVHNGYAYINDGRSTSGYLDPQTGKLELNYQPSPGQYVYQTLRRMGYEVSATLEEIIIGEYTCTGATAGGRTVPIPEAYLGMKIDLGDSCDLPGWSPEKEYYHIATITIGSEEKTGYDWNVDANNVLTVWNDKTGDTWTLQWIEKDDLLLLTLDQADESGAPIVLAFRWEAEYAPEATPQPATSSDLSQERADAFVNGLSVEFEDGAPYSCDLVCYIDGFGTCLNVGDPNAFERASLRYEFLSRNNQNGSIDYAKILSVGELTYYIGDITVFADGDQLVYGEEWNDEYLSADASILVPVNPLMMDRNQSCPERCCVIRSFDPVNRTVTVSFGLQEEMSSDIPGEYVDYSSIETEQITLKVTDETFLTLVGNDYDTLVKPDRFFRFFEEYEFIDLYLFDENNEDASIGFWIGVDGDTLLYLCEMKEV